MRRNLSLPLRLALLVAGTTLPMILFAAGVVYLNHARDRDAAFDRVLSTVRGILLVLDAEMQGITSGLEALAASQSLARGDLEAFRRSTEAFLKRFPETAPRFSRQPRRAAAVQQQCCPGRGVAGAGEPHIDRRGVSHREAGLLQPLRRLRLTPAHHHGQRSRRP